MSNEYVHKKLGVVHSGYSPIIPLGSNLCLRFMLDDYQKGDFWLRRMYDHDEYTPEVYLDQRTYYQQITNAIAENANSIFFAIDTPLHDFTHIQSFIHDIVHICRFNWFTGEIIFATKNEPLEMLDFKGIHYLNRIASDEIKKYPDVKFAVGEMASNFTTYYETYLHCNYKYDYISFLTDNNCTRQDTIRLLNIFPKNTVFINNEHYHINGAKKYGYDDPKIASRFIEETLEQLKEPRIKQIYVCLPYGLKNAPHGHNLFFNKVNIKTAKITTTLAWKSLKEIDKEGENLMKLEILKINSRHWQVFALQQSLTINGFECGKIDGWFGEKTEKALQEYNIEHNILSVTICNYATWLSFYVSDMSSKIIDGLIKMIQVI
jgi:hypothetical protein